MAFELEGKTKDYISKTFRLPKEVMDELSSVAEKKNISLNEAVRQCLEYALSQM